MSIYKKLVISSILASLMLANCSANEIENIKAEAKNAIKIVGGKLKHTLGQKIKEGGATNAADFCSTSADKVAQEAAKSLPKGVTVKRITAKPRNVYNKAVVEQLKVLNELEEKVKSGNVPKLVVKKLSKNHYQVYKPLIIGKKCLTCHGDAKTRNKKAYEIISKKYPNDEAIDYKIGELRGAFLVDIIK